MVSIKEWIIIQLVKEDEGDNTIVGIMDEKSDQEVISFYNWKRKECF